ncbi:MAG: carboxylesterase family protein [Candidatus Acidiferrales bacterium]
MKFAVIAVIAACVVVVAARQVPAGSASLPLVIQTDNGAVQGAPGTVAGVRAFKGIPFAAPPVGDLRWRAPQPAAAWKGTLDATHFGAICPQHLHTPGSISYFDPGPQTPSEDCLTLNVWTAARAASDKLPVMVWIYGGAFDHGSSMEKYYWSDDLAHKGAVVVTFNYRVGALGFLAYPELSAESEHHTSGNYGLLDQIAALEWVRRNIAAFGGDPNNVTIFGQSAGAMSVTDLTVSPLAAGLFGRAIAESGGLGRAPRKLAEAETAGVAWAASVGAKNLADLRRLTPEQLIAVPAPGGPIVDGYVIPDDPAAIYRAGKQADVPMIFGSTSNEGGLSKITITAAAAQANAQTLYGADAAAYLALYPASTDAEAVDSAYLFIAERAAANERTLARLASTTGKSPVYLYRWSHALPEPADANFSEGPNSQFGAYHASELLYVFDDLHLRDWPWTDVDRRLADEMSQYWFNFAATGNPNGAGLPVWPAFDAQHPMMMNFGDVPAAEAVSRAAALDFIDAHPAAMRR